MRKALRAPMVLAWRRARVDEICSVPGGAAFAWYTGSLKDRILEMLSEDERIRRGKYQVTVSVWVRDDGTIEQIKLRSTSGDRTLDQAIEESLRRMHRAQEAPPLEMPQPVTLRIVSK